jgi:hypothetical protein
MMDENPIQTARRISRRENQQRCLVCGRSNDIEQHHVAGRRNDPAFTQPLCQAHHALVTEELRKTDVRLSHEPNSIKRVKNALKATAVFLRMLAEALGRWADWL